MKTKNVAQIFILLLCCVIALPCSLVAAQARHAAEVVLISKVDNSNYDFFSVDSSGVILGWKGTPNRLAQISSMQLAAYDPATDVFAFSKERTVSVIADFFRSLASDAGLNAMSKEIGSRVTALAIGEEQSVLAGAFDATVYRWKFGKETAALSKSEKEKLIERYIGPAEPISAVAQHTIGHVFFTADWAGTINGFKPYDADRLKGAYQTNQAYSPYFTSASLRVRTGRDALLGKPTIAPVVEALQKSRLEKLVLVPPAGQELVSATSEGTLEIWKVRGMKVVGILPDAHNGSLYGLAATSDFVATSGRDGTVKVFKMIRLSAEQLKQQRDRSLTHQLELVKEFPLPDVRTLMFLTDRKVVAGTRDGQVLLLEW